MIVLFSFNSVTLVMSVLMNSKQISTVIYQFSFVVVDGDL